MVKAITVVLVNACALAVAAWIFEGIRIGGQAMDTDERLLNLAIARLPARYDKVGWFDADILFTNPDWVALTKARLEEVPLLQPFETALYTEADGRPGPLRRRAIAANIAAGRPDAWDLGRSHPGFAWAARRSTCSPASRPRSATSSTARCVGSTR